MNLPFKYYFMCMTLHDMWSQNRPQPECPPVVTAPPPVVDNKHCACPSYGYQLYCDPAECGVDGLCKIALPRNYIAYHLGGEKIKIDGNLEDPAWTNVPWSSKFVDIRGTNFPPPRFDTMFKLRWDDKRLYIGALLKAKDIWATFTVDDSYVYQDNSFGLFFSPDGTMHNYKQIDINALGTSWDLMLRKAYIDGGGSSDLSWSSDVIKAVASNGPVNDVKTSATFWSVEMSIPFSKLVEGSQRTGVRPLDDEVLFMQFARPEYPFYIENGKYKKNGTAAAEWWSWQPHGVVNLHIPSRWGLVQFSRTRSNTGFRFPRWHIYKALFDLHEAMHMYKAVNGVFPNDVRMLNLPPFLRNRKCLFTPTLELLSYGKDFVITVRSKHLNEEGSIRADRSVSFSS